MSDSPVFRGCCAPSRAAEPSPGAAGIPAAASSFSQEGMVRLDGGAFLMGSQGPEAWPADGEGPVREVTLRPFWIDACTVTNRQFSAFIAATGYVTEAERFGWSFVHHSQLDKRQRTRLDQRVLGLEWWHRVDGAFWRYPLGDGSTFEQLKREDHPVVHVSWHDAETYAHWAGKRLPTEAEWEYASRGGLSRRIYPWGDELTPGGKHLCNIWQGTFPTTDLGQDGYRGTAPARSFKPNAFGLYNTTGNVWEWTADWFTPQAASFGRDNPAGPPFGSNKVMKGGSYLCHASYCNRYRCAARTSNTPDSSTGHLGFRCAADCA